ncbi:MAG: class I SAM-dependent methyltransferase [Methylophilaceae bacterium]
MQVIEGRKLVYRHCPQCNTDNNGVKPHAYSPSEWDLKVCANCGFVYLDAAPVYEELLEDFAWEKTSNARHEKRKKKHPILYKLSKATRWRLHLLKRKTMEDLLPEFVSAGKVVDLGCGKGHQLMKLPDNYLAIGIEISTAEAKVAEKLLAVRSGLVINKSSLEGLQSLSAGEVSAVFMRSYLEHETRPKEVLQETFRVLRGGGVAIIKVPNYGCVNRVVMGSNWCGFRFPDHLNYFTPETLKNMIHGVGFEVARFNFMDHLPTGDNMWMVIRKPA